MTLAEIDHPLDRPETACLQLYLCDSSTRSRQMERQIREFLKQELPGAYRLEVIDVTAEPERAEAANVGITPTLIAPASAPPRRLIGEAWRADQIRWLVGRTQCEPPPAGRSSSPEPSGPDLSALLADLCPDGILLADDDGRILAANPAACRLLDAERQQLDGHMIGLSAASSMALSLAQTGRPSVMIRVAARSWNGRPAHLIMLRDLGEPAREADPDIAALLETNQTLRQVVADLSRADEEQWALCLQLERSNGDFKNFANRVAHDIKNPLRSMRQLARFVLEDEEEHLAEDSKESLTSVIATSRRLEQLLDGLLDFAKAGAADRPLTTVDPRDVLKWVQADLNPIIKSVLGLCDVGPMPKVKGNATELYQLFLNLIGNAIKYHRPNVPPIVTITAAPLPGNSAEAPMVRIAIADNGIGFDQADAETIFKPFTRLVGNREFEGSGIGLATVRKITERHQGKVWAVSKAGEGSTFFIELQMAD
jgi:signal transduction histidine kinase